MPFSILDAVQKDTGDPAPAGHGLAEPFQDRDQRHGLIGHREKFLGPPQAGLTVFTPELFGTFAFDFPTFGDSTLGRDS